jgi:hypothetical protein
MGQRKGNKRRKVTAVEDVAASVDLDEGWIAKFLELPGDELAKLLGDIANHGKIKTTAIRKARTSLPSFSGTGKLAWRGKACKYQACISVHSGQRALACICNNTTCIFALISLH